MGHGGIGGEAMSVTSPQASFVNVGSTITGATSVAGATSMASGAASMIASNLGNSIGSIKGRFSRLGSLNFGRHHVRE